MDLSSAKLKFIREWGTLCCNWGANRAMGQIHAVLLIANEDMSADQIMEELQISRGNVNMNLRSLIDWRLIEKIHKPGCRKDHFRAEKDLSKVFKLIIQQRKKKEFDPLKEMLEEMQAVRPKCVKSDEFCRVMQNLTMYVRKVDHALSAMTNSKMQWLTKIISR